MRITRIILAVTLLTPLISFARTDITIKLSKKLNEMKIYDYSIYVLEQDIAEKPADIDLLRIQLAQTYSLKRMPEDAKKIIKYQKR